MISSIIHDSKIFYPDKNEFFSPSTLYPEYPFKHVASKPNMVYSAVRECFMQAELDAHNFGTAKWNPLKNYIKQGDGIFILCNFVYHRRNSESKDDFFAKCTHASIIRAIIDYVFIAVGQEGSISFGNAPLQSCVWEQVLEDTGSNVVLDFYKFNNARVSAKDLRLFVAHRNNLGQIVFEGSVRNDEGIVVNLNQKSLLDELYKGQETVKFRVSDYNPDRTETMHALHKHKYIINKRVLSSNVVLSIPKLKTHEKVGITVGLKGFVGSVGQKDCLAHHRFGPTRLNGDEYPDNSRAQILVSRFHDFVYRRNYPQCFNSLFEIADKSLGKVLKKIFKKTRAGAWYGNDTAWRMTVDLANILYFADTNGFLSDKPKRKHLVFVDGVIGGEGEGPLSPTPVASNSLIFSDNVVAGDVVACKLMGYDTTTIPSIYYLEREGKLTDNIALGKIFCVLNGKRIRVDDLRPVLNRSFVPPTGWQGHL
jgi:uncharacterized protein (DUF362 family)